MNETNDYKAMLITAPAGSDDVSIVMTKAQFSHFAVGLEYFEGFISAFLAEDEPVGAELRAMLDQITPITLEVLAELGAKKEAEALALAG